MSSDHIAANSPLGPTKRNLGFFATVEDDDSEALDHWETRRLASSAESAGNIDTTKSIRDCSSESSCISAIIPRSLSSIDEVSEKGVLQKPAICHCPAEELTSQQVHCYCRFQNPPLTQAML